MTDVLTFRLWLLADAIVLDTLVVECGLVIGCLGVMAAERPALVRHGPAGCCAGRQSPDYQTPMPHAQWLRLWLPTGLWPGRLAACSFRPARTTEG
nr:unnamed protein product [Digitaria exilis]